MVDDRSPSCWGTLPVVGVAILLRYLPTKQYIPYLMVGFFLAAYLQVPMMGIAIVGIVAALLVFKRDSAKPAQAEAGATSSQNFEGGFDGDE